MKLYGLKNGEAGIIMVSPSFNQPAVEEAIINELKVRRRKEILQAKNKS